MDHVATNVVEEILRVTDQQEDFVPFGQVVLKPNDGLHIQVVCRLIKEQADGLNEQGPGQGDSHSPSSRKILGFLLLHLVGKSQPTQNGAGSYLGRVGVQGIEALVHRVQGVHDFLLELFRRFLGLGRIAIVSGRKSFRVVNDVRHELVEVFGLLFELGSFLVDFHDGIQCRQGVAGFDFFLEEENINRLGDRQCPGTQSPQERRFSAAVATHQSITVSVVENDGRLVKEDGPHVQHGHVRNINVSSPGVNTLAGCRKGADGSGGRQSIRGLVVDPIVQGPGALRVSGGVQGRHLGSQCLGIFLCFVLVFFLALVLGGLFGLALLLGESLFLFL
mmetsp:Transcript_11723/g.29695  ORF Transcript_11723/g.29695 Transcript_11723/m.29695 type:complete len:334 (-) Transcript_11723:290-1291(-)